MKRRSITISREAWLSLSPDDRKNLDAVRSARRKATRKARRSAKKRYKPTY